MKRIIVIVFVGVFICAGLVHATPQTWSYLFEGDIDYIAGSDIAGSFVNGYEAANGALSTGHSFAGQMTIQRTEAVDSTWVQIDLLGLTVDVFNPDGTLDSTFQDSAYIRYIREDYVDPYGNDAWRWVVAEGDMNALFAGDEIEGYDLYALGSYLPGSDIVGMKIYYNFTDQDIVDPSGIIHSHTGLWRVGVDANDYFGGAIDSVNPVPEPATLFLLGTGLTGLAGLARRRKRG